MVIIWSVYLNHLHWPWLCQKGIIIFTITFQTIATILFSSKEFYSYCHNIGSLNLVFRGSALSVQNYQGDLWMSERHDVSNSGIWLAWFNLDCHIEIKGAQSSSLLVDSVIWHLTFGFYHKCDFIDEKELYGSDVDTVIEYALHITEVNLHDNNINNNDKIDNDDY